MRKHHGFLGGLAAGLAVLAYVHAQSIAPSDKLHEAVSLLNNGQPKEARAVIATIAKTDPAYTPAKAYDALCLFELNDKRKFLELVDTPEVQRANIPSQVREQLDCKQIDALFYYRKLEDLINKAGEFPKRHADSPHLKAVAEYRLAGLFEHGMKKAYESALLTETNGGYQQWQMGLPSLQQFVVLAQACKVDGYEVLTNRSLLEDYWVSRMTLGEEAELLKNAANAPAEDRERLALLGIQLYQKLQPKNVDANLQRMRKFVADFPESKHRKRVEFDMAEVSFGRGEACLKEADAAERRKDAHTAAARRDQAHDYFSYTLQLKSKLMEDKEAGIAESDVVDKYGDLFTSYYLERNYRQIVAEATVLVQTSEPGGTRWLLGKVYRGIALRLDQPDDPKAATAELDEVLAAGIKGRADHDRQVLDAAQWRIFIAQQEKDDARALEIVQWVESSPCSKNQKATFFKTREVLAVTQQTAAK